jgi:thiamine-monophosphate kinase
VVETDDPAVDRHLRPQPRLDLGRYLRKTERATAAIDLSDGLSTDVRRVAQASGVGIEIDASAIPRFGGASPKQALHGGEEYELLFTARPSSVMPKNRKGLRLTQIGRVVARRGVYVISPGKQRLLKSEGFEHF